MIRAKSQTSFLTMACNFYQMLFQAVFGSLHCQSRLHHPQNTPSPKPSHSSDVRIQHKKQNVNNRRVSFALQQSLPKHTTKAAKLTSPYKNFCAKISCTKRTCLLFYNSREETTVKLSNSKTSRRTNPQNIKKNISTLALINKFNNPLRYRTGI